MVAQATTPILESAETCVPQRQAKRHFRRVSEPPASPDLSPRHMPHGLMIVSMSIARGFELPVDQCETAR